jgi:hypothetical protein
MREDLWNVFIQTTGPSYNIYLPTSEVTALDDWFAYGKERTHYIVGQEPAGRTTVSVRLALKHVISVLREGKVADDF